MNTSLIYRYKRRQHGVVQAAVWETQLIVRNKCCYLGVILKRETKELLHSYNSQTNIIACQSLTARSLTILTSNVMPHKQGESEEST